jgi:hypothetical protein
MHAAGAAWVRACRHAAAAASRHRCTVTAACLPSLAAGKASASLD